MKNKRLRQPRHCERPKGAKQSQQGLLRRYLGVLLTMTMVMTGPAFAAESPEDCAEQCEPARASILKSIFRMEHHFVQMNWYDWKHRQTAYEDVWQARTQARDLFSPEQRAEGEVRFERYLHLAESYRETAEEERDAMLEHFESLFEKADELDSGCTALKFMDCTNLWKKEFRGALEQFRKVLHRYVEEQIKAREQIEATLKESPSEHHDFADRYHELHVRWVTDFHPQILNFLHELREEAEYGWPAEKCCVHCTPEEVEVAESQLYQYVRPDPEASLGVQGGPLEKRSLLNAFEEMEERERQEI